MSTTERLEPTGAAAEPFDPWFAGRIAAAATGGDGGTRTALVERQAPRRGLMPPLHAHGEVETFRVLDGELTFFVGDDIIRASAGEMIVVPAGVARTYRVDSDGARWLVLTQVVSLGRYEDFGRALAPPPEADRASWPSDDELRTLTAIADANRIAVLGPPGMLPQDL